MPDLTDHLTETYTDPCRYADLMGRYGMSRMAPVIITCAITGGVQGKEANPALPETVEEQAQSTYDAYNAGAAMVHIHRRDPRNTSEMSYQPEEFLEVNQAIRAKCPDIIVNDTCMGGHFIDTVNGTVGPAARGSIGARPEVASLDITTGSTRMLLKPRPGFPGREKTTQLDWQYNISMTQMVELSSEMLANGIKPEYEMFSLNDIKFLNHIIAGGAAQAPYWVSLIVGGNGTWPTPETLIQAGQLLPPSAMLNIISIGACQTAMMTLAMILGYNIRVGLEDNVMYGPGELAKSNAQLVERAVHIANVLGRPVATPAQAREMMGLGAPRQF